MLMAYKEELMVIDMQMENIVSWDQVWYEEQEEARQRNCCVLVKILHYSLRT